MVCRWANEWCAIPGGGRGGRQYAGLNGWYAKGLYSLGVLLQDLFCCGTLFFLVLLCMGGAPLYSYVSACVAPPCLSACS